jgi:hypothetical protein
MKTLREMMDQLDEISRRDLLKGAGAVALVPTIAKAQSTGYPDDVPIPKANFWKPRSEFSASVKDLSASDRQSIVVLINIYYLSKIFGKDNLSTQSLDLLKALHRTYHGINLSAAMSEAQRQIYQINQQTPEKNQNAQLYFLSPQVTNRIFTQIEKMVSEPTASRNLITPDSANFPVTSN